MRRVTTGPSPSYTNNTIDFFVFQRIFNLGQDLRLLYNKKLINIVRIYDKAVSDKKLPAAANYCQDLQSHLHLLAHLALCQ